MALRIILTTGGTGGHIFPALAVAEALRRKRPDAEILFIGGLYGPEKELAEKRAGYRRKYQRRKELAAQRAAEAEQQNKANA